MFSNDFITPPKNNSEVVKHVLNTLIYSIKRKTNEGHAVSMIDSLIHDLQEDHEFLIYVKLKDTRLLEDDSIVDVKKDIDEIMPLEVGKALNNVIYITSRFLGKRDGYFLIKEFQHRIGSNYYSSLRAMGIDLDLLLLELKVATMFE
jgi:hypothetical protein